MEAKVINTISIIIPAYNVQNNIHNTLNSLLVQTVHDFEIIIVNDGSIDNTLSIVENILSKSNFNNYKIINKENGGVSSARNRGISEATGEYIFFLDGDDYVSYDMVGTVKSYINNGKPDVIAWGYNSVREDKSVLSCYFNLYSSELNRMTGMEALKNILIRNRSLRIWTCSAVYKKDLIIDNKLLYTEGCSNGEDQEFTFKALSRANKFCFINKILSFYVQREGSISNSYNINRFDAIAAMNRTARYIRESLLGESEEIAHYIEYNYLIDNYLSIFYSCMEYLLTQKKLSSIQAINYLMNDIDKAYSGLNADINNKIQFITNINLKTKMKYKLFLKNPVFFFNVTNLSRKLKLLK